LANFEKNGQVAFTIGERIARNYQAGLFYFFLKKRKPTGRVGFPNIEKRYTISHFIS
jgi:hypothetical protein